MVEAKKQEILMSSKSELLRILRDEKARKDSVDWDTQRTEWLSALSNLRAQIYKWLSEAITEDLLKVDDNDFEVHENDLGTYMAPGLMIKTPKGYQIQMKPIAKFTLGGQGRVDISSGPNKAVLIKGDEDNWFFGIYNHLSSKMNILNEESFVKILVELIR